MRSRRLVVAGLALAAAAFASTGRAADNAPAPGAPAPGAPAPGAPAPGTYAPGTYAPTDASGAAAPNAPPPPPRARPQKGGQVQQRSDTEIPVHHRPIVDPDPAPPVRPQKPVTSVSGTPSGYARVQPDPPPRRPSPHRRPRSRS